MHLNWFTIPLGAMNSKERIPFHDSYYNKKSMKNIGIELASITPYNYSQIDLIHPTTYSCWFWNVAISPPLNSPVVVRGEQKGDTVLNEILIRIESTPPEKENVDLFSVPSRIADSAKVTLGSEETVPGDYSDPKV